MVVDAAVSSKQASVPAPPRKEPGAGELDVDGSAPAQPRPQTTSIVHVAKFSSSSYASLGLSLAPLPLCDVL